MPRYVLLCLLLASASLQSCKSDFNSLRSKRSTSYYLRDTSVMLGEFLGRADDSIFVLRSDLAEPDSARTIRVVHYSELESVVFLNDNPAALNGFGGLIGGTLIGAVGGLLIGDLTDQVGHSGGWGALGGLLFGGQIGAVVGLVIGISSGTDATIFVEDRADLEKMDRFARFSDATELRRYARK